MQQKSVGGGAKAWGGGRTFLGGGAAPGGVRPLVAGVLRGANSGPKFGGQAAVAAECREVEHERGHRRGGGMRGGSRRYSTGSGTAVRM
eukprot:SAG31_NODE_864_length_11392_cov_21.929868_3_plen_89_part_00